MPCGKLDTHRDKEAQGKNEIRLRPRIDARPDPCPATCRAEESRMQNDIQGRPARAATKRPALLRCLKKLEPGDTLTVYNRSLTD